ncbi:MAG: DUF1343 domain-containing protein [Bacteroidia bacterium]|nr:DUF1343 domain-containing protein [Bacteroidia bacterium]
MKDIYFVLLLILASINYSCNAKPTQNTGSANAEPTQLKVGAESFDKYINLLHGKNVAIVANQTSIVGDQHLVDTLLAQGIKVKIVFAPEHGFRGTADAGAYVDNSVDSKTGLPIVSLYGKNKKPNSDQLEGINCVVFDIQDVGTRFYTYISTLQYVMEAAADSNISVIVLDRPNPNGFYVDGPVLDTTLRSFVGMNPIPIVHGLTVGEYAKMMVGENWLNTNGAIRLTVIPVDGYTHSTLYKLPIKPSPNLPNSNSIYLYPSLCLFEGTVISVGRGTDKPFQHIGHPDFKYYPYSFTPKSVKGAALNPKHKNIPCYGKNLQNYSDQIDHTNMSINLEWLIDFYNEYDYKEDFFNSFFNKLSGTKDLQSQIKDGLSAEEIKLSWEFDLNEYKKMRKKYLIYPDFESN